MDQSDVLERIDDEDGQRQDDAVAVDCNNRKDDHTDCCDDDDDDHQESTVCVDRILSLDDQRKNKILADGRKNE